MSEESIEIFIPGRLCLFGEHSDWAGLHRMINADIVPGSAIVTGIEQGIFANEELTVEDIKEFYESRKNTRESNHRHGDRSFIEILLAGSKKLNEQFIDSDLYKMNLGVPE